MTLTNTGSVPGHRLVLTNAQVLDVETGTYLEGAVVAEGGRIVQVGGDAPSGGTDAEVVDLAGAFVLPGLIDCHVHVTAATAALADLRTWPPSYVTAHAARSMRAMLGRGFTTVRDTGGADFGLAKAQREGLIEGPRLLFGGKALSQTGGHGTTEVQERPRTTGTPAAPVSARWPTGSTRSAAQHGTCCGPAPTTSR